eukprot:TRINITY_DN15795_c0_g1_i1.p1 TRINITY_DN15795_c0_g1~~TRINITY_DN15795_c0_g1_i1.p1  ORF type:complete len:204 (+),score=31.32 TRINITY_DN15795_c0_g1_i1:164-775(+)
MLRRLLQVRYYSGKEAAWERSFPGREWSDKCRAAGVADPWEVLDVKKGANWNDIKEAHRKLAFSHHPDRGGDSKSFSKISEAYSLLKKRNASIEKFEAGEHDQNPHINFGQFYEPYGTGPDAPPDTEGDWAHEDNPARRRWYLRLKEQKESQRKLQAEFEANAKLYELRSRILFLIFLFGAYCFLKPLIYPEWRDKRPDYLKN